MRNVLKFALAALAAVAALAVMAQGASAQMEVTDEATGLHCGTVSLNTSTQQVTGGCVAHGVSTGAVFLQGHILGVETGDTDCMNEFDLHTNENGAGYLANQSLTHPPGTTDCTRIPCTVGNQGTSGVTRPWPVQAQEVGPNNERLEASFCVENLNGSLPLNCHIFVPLVETGSHAYEFGSLDGSGDPVEVGCEPVGIFSVRGEVSGHWISEGGPGASSGIELSH